VSPPVFWGKRPFAHAAPPSECLSKMKNEEATTQSESSSEPALARLTVLDWSARDWFEAWLNLARGNEQNFSESNH